MCFLKAIVAAVLLHALLCAQNNRIVRGDLLSSQVFVGSAYVAQIYDQANHTVLERTPVSPTGHFEFHSVGNGAYVVQIVTENGDAVASAALDNAVALGPVQIRLPEQEERKPIAGLVSAARLRHPPGRKAFDEVVKAQKFSQAGDRPQAIEHLRKALELSPDFIDAHTNLGAQYMRTGRYAEALAEYRAVVDLGAAGTAELCNLSAALFAVKQIGEAEAAARRALALDSRSAIAHYLLGRAILPDATRRAEARQHLLLAAPSMPQAATFLAMF